jgi:hypothetical protein
MTFEDDRAGHDVNKSLSAPGTVTGSLNSTDGGTGSGQATISANQSVSVSLNLAAGPSSAFANGGIGGRAAAILDYAMYISSATTQSVQVNVNAMGGATITNNYPQYGGFNGTQLQSQRLILGGDGSALGFGQNVIRNGTDISSFSWSTNQDYTFKTNTRYDIELETYVTTAMYNIVVATARPHGLIY